MTTLVLSIALAGCGGDAAPERTVALDAAADGSLAFARTTVTTTPGRVRFVMGNPSRVPHAIGIRGAGVDARGEDAGTGEESAVTATVAAGEYTLFCPVGGHEAAGMVARLDVG